MRVRNLAAYIPAFLLVLFPATASAHSFGILYNLPVPFWLYLYGGSGAIVASFIIISYLVGKKQVQHEHKELLLTNRGLGFATKDWFVNLTKIASVLFFALTVGAGLFGLNESYSNISMAAFWIVFVLGFTYLVAMIGDVYSVINPIKIIAGWSEKLMGEKMNPIKQYPKWLGYYPALIFYFLFIYIELFGGTTPFKISSFVLQYLFLSMAGIIFWGKEIWFKYCDFFSVFFRLIGKLSIIYSKDNKIYLRPPIVGILKEKIESFSELLFILFMLSSTAFDGFHSTRLFYDLYDWLRFIPYEIFQTGFLILSPFIFLGVYIFLIWLTKIIAKSAASLKNLSLHFALTLVPIALAYNVAHYYTLIITEGQVFIRLLSDPFGFGWNLFGTSGFEPSLALVDPNITWHAQVIIILLGHIAGVYLAHVEAIKMFPNTKHAILSQLPMLILMVTYTMAGLWILSQPITSGI